MSEVHARSARSPDRGLRAAAGSQAPDLASRAAPSGRPEECPPDRVGIGRGRRQGAGAEGRGRGGRVQGRADETGKGRAGQGKDCKTLQGKAGVAEQGKGEGRAWQMWRNGAQHKSRAALAPTRRSLGEIPGESSLAPVSSPPLSLPFRRDARLHHYHDYLAAYHHGVITSNTSII